ncbi:MAG: hypothetical protein LBV04_03520 [Deferribacteraceae bacterium]|jgi:hypothetical protein|nr:hypothetical protein [Deferribacteraceae bacterium]
MRLLFIAIILAFLTVLPVVIIGIKHGDGAYTTNTYNRSLDYDEGRKIATAQPIIWGEPACVDSQCSLPYTSSQDFSLRIFRPTDNTELLTAKDSEQVSFRDMGSGWYVLKVDYEKDAVLVSDESSIYIK